MKRIFIEKTSPKFIEAVRLELEAKKERFAKYFEEIKLIKEKPKE